MSTTQKQNNMSDDAERIPLDESGEVTLTIVEILTGRGFITGKSGSGKSNTASVVVEELLDRGFPVLIVDTDGEYWGLKEDYEILHVGADEECDLQVGPEHAEKLAELALEQSVPIILDVSGYLDEDDASALVRETASALFAKEKKLNKPFLMLVEEIHEFLPETAGTDETARMLTRVAKRGRKRGLGLCGMSQRPADVKKDFITQCDWLMWHRLTWENDTKVVGHVVGNDYREPVQHLEDGEALLMADFLEADVQRVQVRRKRTYDAGATPGLDDYDRPELKSVSGDLVDELEEISEREERRQDRIAQLESVIEEKNEQIEELEDELEAERQNNETVQQLADKLANISGGDGGGEALEEIREEKNAEIRELEREVEERDERTEDLEARVSDLQQELDQRPDLSDRAAEAVEVLADEFGVADDNGEKWRRKYRKAQERINELETGSGVSVSADGDGTDVQQSILNEFQDEAVERLLERAEGLSDRQQKLLKYLEARDRTVGSQKAWAQDALGLTKNPSSTYYDAMGELIEDGFARKNKDGSVAPNLRGLVEDELSGYDADDDTIDEVHREVLSRL